MTYCPCLHIAYICHVLKIKAVKSKQFPGFLSHFLTYVSRPYFLRSASTFDSFTKKTLLAYDPRVKGWLLLENYTPTFIFSVLYLLIVWLGPKYMRNKQPFSCRGILQNYILLWSAKCVLFKCV
uniref:very-long-chain 3-oxoacyl-CoA synthase n=1 Tax=Pavo cristatus TaxID=9049 RepID=A0A8C9G175_PAVCR